MNKGGQDINGNNYNTICAYPAQSQAFLPTSEQAFDLNYLSPVNHFIRRVRGGLNTRSATSYLAPEIEINLNSIDRSISSRQVQSIDHSNSRQGCSSGVHNCVGGDEDQVYSSYDSTVDSVTESQDIKSFEVCRFQTQ